MRVLVTVPVVAAVAREASQRIALALYSDYIGANANTMRLASIASGCVQRSLMACYLR